MQISIQYQPSYSLGIVSLAAGESVLAESGAMVSMSGNVQIQTQMQGGIFGALKRKVLGGESLFTNTFTAVGAPGEVTLAPTLPGDLNHITLAGGTLFIQSGSFVACAPGVSLDTAWGGSRGFFSGEGLFLLKAMGSGDLLISSYGAIHRVDLDGRSPYVVDTGHVVAFASGLSYSVKGVGGIKSTLLSGEGLVCEFTGQGPLYLQTRSTQAFLSWLLPRVQTSGGRSTGGGLGGLLGGE